MGGGEKKKIPRRIKIAEKHFREKIATPLTTEINSMIREHNGNNPSNKVSGVKVTFLEPTYMFDRRRYEVDIVISFTKPDGRKVEETIVGEYLGIMDAWGNMRPVEDATPENTVLHRVKSYLKGDDNSANTLATGPKVIIRRDFRDKVTRKGLTWPSVGQ